MLTTETLTDRLLLFEMAEQLAGFGHWSLDFRTGVVGWSPELFRLHGLKPSATAPSYQALLALYLPEDAARLDHLVQRAAAAGEAYAFEGRILRPDGQVRRVSAKAHCQLDDSGRCITLFGIVQDITGQSRSNPMTQNLLSQLPAMAAYWNTDLRCVFANARYVEWFGLTPETIVGVRMRTLWGEELYEANRSHVETALRGEACVFERSLTNLAGGFAHMLAQYVPDRDEDGFVRGFFLLVSDLTELKTSELRLEAANAELAKARNLAEAATRAKSEFLSNMSHELRTPLNSIVGFGEILVRENALDPVAKGHLRRIRDASHTLLSTINDILDFSKLEAGQIEVERRRLDPGELGRAALELLQPQAEAKGLYRAFEPLGLPAHVLGDETRIRQILLNLLSNAIKFTAQGGVTLRAIYEDVAQTLRFEVIDSGLGIPPDRISRLFQRFSQVDASTNRTFGGTGLGLAICRGLAEAMGGRIGVHSVPGEGSTFWFELPCVAVESCADVEDDEESIDLTQTLKGLRVLVVDDNPANRELVRIICEQFDIICVEAGCGAEAVSQAKAQPFDVILLDIRMPEVDGPAVAQILRNNPGPNRSTPIIGFTADCAMEFPPSWGPLFNARLAKPVVPADLLSGLAEFSPNVKAATEVAA